VVFEFEVAEAGTYAIEAGVHAQDDDANSFFVRVDAAPDLGWLWDLAHDTSYADAFVSDRGGPAQVTVELEAGAHTVWVQLREDGARIDDLRLVNLSGGSSTPRIEAEDATLFGRFVVGNDPVASGGAYVHTPELDDGIAPRVDPTEVDEVVFPASFPIDDVEIVANAAAPMATDLDFTATLGAGIVYRWSFGDGTPETEWSTLPDASHAFAGPGRYNVVLTVRDTLTTEERSVVATQIVYDAAIDPGDEPQRRLSSSSVTFHPTRDEIWNVNPDNDSVSAIDATNLVRLAEIPVGPNPRSLAVAPDGRVWVVCKRSSEIHVVDPASGSVDAVIALGSGLEHLGPHGIVFAPSGAVAYLALEATGEVVELDAGTGAILRRAAVGPDPRHLAIRRDGATLYVSRFVTPAVPGEDTAAPQPELGGGEVLALSTTDLAIQGTIVVGYSDDGATEGTGPGLPNYLGPLALSPDGARAYVPSKQDNVLGGDLRPGAALDSDHTVRAVSSRIDLAAGSESTPERIDHDNASVAGQTVFGPYGIHLFTCLEGNRQIAISDTLAHHEIGRFDVGRAPQGIALSPDGKRLAVHNFMDRSVEVVDVAGGVDFGGTTPSSLAAVSTVESEALAPDVLLGKQHFYDARDDRLAALDYMSCASCHADGGGDGRTWDFSQFGEGLRTTISLRGHGTGQGRLHWSANFDEVQDFEGQIRSFALGAGLMSNADFFAGTRSDPLGDPKAGLSPDLDALAAYVESLTQVGVSPHRPADGTLGPEGLAGRNLFISSGCHECHPGPPFTDSATGVPHDVGTLAATSGPQTALDTPTLVGLWETPPYLHDGSASTLQQAVEHHTLLGHDFDAQQLDSLAAYLLRIDDVETAAWAGPDGDGDGFADEVDAFPGDPAAWLDSDGDGVSDSAELGPPGSPVRDSNMNGIPAYLDPTEDGSLLPSVPSLQTPAAPLALVALLWAGAWLFLARRRSPAPPA